jgi:hypothetical protein
MPFRSQNVSSEISRTLKQFGSKAAASEEATRTFFHMLSL